MSVRYLLFLCFDSTEITDLAIVMNLFNMATTKLVVASTPAAADTEMYVCQWSELTILREEQKEEAEQTDDKQNSKKGKKDKKDEKDDQQKQTQYNLLDLVPVFIPLLDMKNTELLFRAIEPLLRDPNNKARKKALKVPLQIA